MHRGSLLLPAYCVHFDLHVIARALHELARVGGLGDALPVEELSRRAEGGKAGVLEGAEVLLGSGNVSDGVHCGIDVEVAVEGIGGIR